MVLAQPLSSSFKNIDTSSSLSVDADMEEDVGLLRTLFEGKNPPAAQTIKQLLDSTRVKRMEWLKSEVSIADIFEKYPCLKISKWVCSFYQCVRNFRALFTLPKSRF